MTRRSAIRLRVVYRRVTCPIGRNSYDDSYLKDIRKGDMFDPVFRSALSPISGSVNVNGKNGDAREEFGPYNLLHDCYLRASAQDHPCHGCKQVDTWKKTIGLRTFKIEPELTTVNTFGQPHEVYPLCVVFVPLNQDGTEWYAMNTFTGQRTEVVLDALGRLRTPNGQDPLQEFTAVDSDEMTRRVATRGMVTIPYVEPMWLGVEPRETWHCTCATCTGEEKKMIEDEDDADDSAARRMNVNAHGQRKSAHDYPSAPVKTAMYSNKPATKEQLARAAAKAKAPSSAPPRTWHPSLNRNTVAVRDDDYEPAPRKPKDGDDFITPAAAMSDAFRNMKSSTKKTAPPSAPVDRRRTKPSRPNVPKTPEPPPPTPTKTAGFSPPGRRKSK